jgi:hypothetical protein
MLSETLLQTPMTDRRERLARIVPAAEAAFTWSTS